MHNTVDAFIHVKIPGTALHLTLPETASASVKSSKRNWDIVDLINYCWKIFRRVCASCNLVTYLARSSAEILFAKHSLSGSENLCGEVKVYVKQYKTNTAFVPARAWFILNVYAYFLFNGLKVKTWNFKSHLPRGRDSFNDQFKCTEKNDAHLKGKRYLNTFVQCWFKECGRCGCNFKLHVFWRDKACMSVIRKTSWTS